MGGTVGGNSSVPSHKKLTASHLLDEEGRCWAAESVGEGESLEAAKAQIRGACSWWLSWPVSFELLIVLLFGGWVDGG